jgi:hypothetical protein
MMEPMEACEREPIEAWCKSLPEREAAGPDDSRAGASTYRRRPEASTNRRAANAPANRRAAEASTYRPAANSPAHCRTAETSTHPSATNAPATHCRTAETSTHRSATNAPSAPAHLGIRGRRRCHCAREGNSGQHDHDLTRSLVFLRLSRELRVSLIVAAVLRIIAEMGWHGLAAASGETILSAFCTRSEFSADGIYVVGGLQPQVRVTTMSNTGDNAITKETKMLK